MAHTEKPLGKLENTSAEDMSEWVVLGMALYPLVYLFLSMKRFYTDHLGKCIFRFLALMTMLMINFFLLFLLVAVITLLL
jgi:hypothetical protein